MQGHDHVVRGDFLGQPSVRILRGSFRVPHRDSCQRFVPPSCRTGERGPTAPDGIRPGLSTSAHKDGNAYLETADRGVIRVPLDNLAPRTKFFSRGLSGKPQDGPRTAAVTEVDVTGVGLTPDAAEQNAYTRAIENTVGVLVDAETLVENDRIIRDQVLTFSRGFIEKFEVIRRWDEGLKFVYARATVRVNELQEKLQSTGLATRKFDGRAEFLKLIHERKAEENAAEIFQKEMVGFRPDRIAKLSLIGNLEVRSRDEDWATIRLKASLTPHDDNWRAFSARLRSLLSYLALEQATVTFGKRVETPGHRPGMPGSGMPAGMPGAMPGSGMPAGMPGAMPGSAGGYEAAGMTSGQAAPLTPWQGRGFAFSEMSPGRQDLLKHLGAPGLLLYVFTKGEKEGQITKWQAFRVPQSLEKVIDGATGKEYRIVFELREPSKKPVVKETHPLRLGRSTQSQQLLMPGMPGMSMPGGMPEQLDALPWLHSHGTEDQTGDGMVRMPGMGMPAGMGMPGEHPGFEDSALPRGYFLAPFPCGKPDGYYYDLQFEHEFKMPLSKLKNVTETAVYLEEIQVR